MCHQRHYFLILMKSVPLTKLQNHMNAHLLLPYESASIHNAVIASMMLNRMVEQPLEKRKGRKSKDIMTEYARTLDCPLK